MGILSSTRDMIVAITKPVISTAQAADESLSIATTYIHNRAVSIKLIDKQEVMVSTAERLNELQTKLDSDAKLKALYDSLDAEFA